MEHERAVLLRRRISIHGSAFWVPMPVPLLTGRWRITARNDVTTLWLEIKVDTKRKRWVFNPWPQRVPVCETFFVEEDDLEVRFDETYTNTCGGRDGD